jgi:hypothetical protein
LTNEPEKPRRKLSRWLVAAFLLFVAALVIWTSIGGPGDRRFVGKWGVHREGDGFQESIMVLRPSGYGDWLANDGRVLSTFTWDGNEKRFLRGQNPAGSPLVKRLVVIYWKTFGGPGPWSHDVVALEPERIVLRANPPNTGMRNVTLRRIAE